jgi:hypothetical protein
LSFRFLASLGMTTNLNGMRRSILALLATTFAIVACRSAAEPPAPQQTVQLNDTAKVALGQTVRVPSASLVITFTAVTSDSRCPPNVQCVWAGSVRARLNITDTAGAAVIVELESNAAPHSVRVGRYEIRLLPEVQPAKGETGPYVISLQVSAAPTN